MLVEHNRNNSTYAQKYTEGCNTYFQKFMQEK